MNALKKISAKNRLVVVATIPFLLSGCVAAAAPMMMGLTVGMVGLTGFAVHKTVQSGTGGEVAVAFPSTEDGETIPPQTLPPIQHIAVWQGNEREVYFSEALAASGTFDVTSPAQTSAFVRGKVPTTDLGQLTEREQTEAFAVLCNAAEADMVFAARDLGMKTKKNTFSFSRGQQSYTTDLMGFSCSQNSIVWREQMALIVEIGDKTPSDAERNQIAGEMWAERVIEASRSDTPDTPQAPND